jgi:hypothetical protein
MPARNESIDDMIAKTPDWRGETFAKLRRIIHDADPDIAEEVKWRRPSNPMGAAVFERSGIVCIMGFLKERVRMTFPHGANLPDPQSLFNAMLEGKSRAIDFREHEPIDEAALKALLRSQLELRLAKSAAGARKE